MRAKARTVAAAAALMLAGIASPAVAQAVSESQAFIKAVKEADGAKAQSLLAAPGSTVVNARDGNGESALHIAVRRRDLPWTGFLAKAGAATDATDRAGDTPLGLAVRIGFPEGARTLIAAGAAIDGPNRRGETPLIIAVQTRRMDLVQMLTRNGANPDKTDTAAGYSAKDYAKQDRRSGNILRVLEEKRAPVRKAAVPVR